MSSPEFITVSLDLEDIYRRYPKLSRDYYFLKGEDMGLIQQILQSTRWPLNPEQFEQYRDRITDDVFDRWEQQNFADDDIIRYAAQGSNYTNFYDYTQQLVSFICHSIQSLVAGCPYLTIEIVTIDLRLIGLGQLLLTVRNRLSFS